MEHKHCPLIKSFPSLIFKKINFTVGNYMYVHIVCTYIMLYMYMYMTVVYEGGVEISDEKQKSAILCACAMVTFAQGDIDKCKTFLFKA